MTKCETTLILDVFKRNFNFTGDITVNKSEFEIKLDNEKIQVGLYNEKENSYLMYDYLVWFWSRTEDLSNGRGKNCAINYDEKDFETRLVDFMDEYAFEHKIPRNGTVAKIEVHEEVIKKEEKPSNEPLTLFDFM